MAIYDDKLIIATSDAHVVALDAKTGKVAWDHADRRLEQGLALYRRSLHRQRQGDPGHDRLRQCRARRLLHHRPRHQDRRRAVAGQHHRPSRRSQLRHLERPADGKPVRRFGLDFRQLRSRPEPRVLRHRPALSVDRGDARHAAGKARRQAQRAVFGLDARHQSRHRAIEVVPPASRGRHLGPRLRL